LIFIFITGWGALYSLNFIKDKKSWLASGKVYKVVIEVILRAVMLLFIVFWTYDSLLPRIMDIPRFVTGRWSTVEGYAYIGDKGSKDFYEHVFIGATSYDFFLSSGIKNAELCKITYLPNSHRAINIEKVSKNLPLSKMKVGIPWGPILTMVYGLIVVFVFGYYGFWFLAVASAIFYPLNLYFYISYGKTHGAWLPGNNDALVNIMGGTGLALMVAAVYAIEKLIRRRSYGRYFEKVNKTDGVWVSKIVAQFVVLSYILSTLKYLNII
jgi:hypothetical protein